VQGCGFETRADAIEFHEASSTPWPFNALTATASWCGFSVNAMALVRSRREDGGGRAADEKKAVAVAMISSTMSAVIVPLLSPSSATAPHVTSPPVPGSHLHYHRSPAHSSPCSTVTVWVFNGHGSTTAGPRRSTSVPSGSSAASSADNKCRWTSSRPTTR
jgi:hypothetical protein